MRTRSKLLLAALTAALALTIGAATANAARSFSTTNNTLLTYTSPALTFTGVESGNQIICAVTLTASLHSTGAKTRGTLIGFVNGGRTERCASSLGGGGINATPLVSHARPWHLTLNSFRGTLPRITEVLFTVNNAEFLIAVDREPLFGRRFGCLYRGNVPTETAGMTGAAEYTVRTLIPQRGNNTPLFEDRLNSAVVGCDRLGELRGTFTATLPPVVRLI